MHDYSLARQPAMLRSRTAASAPQKHRQQHHRQHFFDSETNTMGHRLSSITTRTGDGGDTGLGDGSRVPKDHLRVQAMGDVDELNSSLGILLTETMNDDLQQLLTAIQHDLFDLGGELSIPGYRLLKEQRIAALDQAIGDINQHQSPLKEFILPGGARSAALAHLSRTICRRAERALVALARSEATADAAAEDKAAPNVSDTARIYLNRLSDLLFILGREFNRREGRSDVLWKKSQ
jgi:cob(I)alamin adenosyltransferase